ncbi:SET domain-containing protein 5 [Didymosphaeria variabile]|uniref:SET domain-containing protein 5 n=1 Tax=Didymosphaeria variabile TaxID=1932322 RepID=A0A9W9CBV8_9PLEO|nr:SET domain-containing protein 5 [Didymosphaeria variabile]KAJ4354350.1 SET domain-containing protein 5 [Didymosphaeria variabile]
MLTSVALILITFASTATSCSRSSWITHSRSCLGPPQVWEARPSPGKGIGVYASRAIEPGDIILSEPAMIQLTPPEIRDGVAYPLSDIHTLLRSSFDGLSPEDKGAVMSLHAHMTSVDNANDTLMAIIRSNAYITGNSLGLFPKGARINHSCRPNTSQYWDSQLGRRVVYANRRIEEGEEIFATYIPLLHSHEARQRRLDQYGFKCTCDACALERDARHASDQRRQDLQKAFAAFESQLTLSVPKSAIGKRKALKNAKASAQLVEQLEEEGLADYYVKAYHVAAIAHARIEDWKPATLWANKGFETSLLADPKARSTGARELQALTNHLIIKWNDQLWEEANRKG